MKRIKKIRKLTLGGKMDSHLAVGRFFSWITFFLLIGISYQINSFDKSVEKEEYEKAISRVLQYLVENRKAIISKNDSPCFLVNPEVKINTNTSYYYIWNYNFRNYVNSEGQNKSVFRDRFLTGDTTNYVDLEEVIPLKSDVVIIDTLFSTNDFCFKILKNEDYVKHYGEISIPKGTYSFSPMIPLNKPSFFHIACKVRGYEYLFVIKNEENEYLVEHCYYNDFYGVKGIGEFGDFLIAENYKKY